jgi:class 3 adenylate cyclase
MRHSASPGAAAALARMNLDIDVTHVLGAVRVPTLVLHRTGHPSDVRGGRYLASLIPSSRFVELEGDQVFPYLGDSEGLLTEIERFLTELWQAGAWAEPERERVLTTVLFTDIAGSTKVASDLGDARWRELLQQHHALIRSLLLRFRGRELDTAGDGFFASFDGPARAIRCACAITENVRDLGIEVRAGLHTGECEVVEGKVGGIAVHIGARVAAQAAAGEVLVSSTVKDLVAGSDIAFREHGDTELKGVPGEWKLFLVEH